MRQGLFRIATTLVLATFVFGCVFQSLVVLQFSLHRQYIEREVCVMRAAAPGKNTCHGNCYLMRQLRTAEGQEDHPFEHIDWRVDPAVLDEATPALDPCVAMEMVFPREENATLAGWPESTDPVPWG